MKLFESLSLAVECEGETLLLHPERVMFWPNQRTLFAADVHVGKEHAFGRHGIAIPGGISEDTLQRLFRLCDASSAEYLILLGDFMHTTPHHSEQWLQILSELLDQRPKLKVRIVAGNHDRLAGQTMVDRRIQWHNSSLLNSPFVLQHEPCDDSRGFVLAGHLHPTWRLGRTRRASVRASVFWFRKAYAVLPAFGEFTGGVNVVPDTRYDKLYMTGPDCVIEVPTSHRKPRPKKEIP